MIKPQPHIVGIKTNNPCFLWKMDEYYDLRDESPYHPGDILYVRETWQYAYDLDDNDHIIEETGRYLYYADNPIPFNNWLDILIDSETGGYKDYIPWKPSIHMPKEAARIWLRVTDVRVDRLQDMRFEDCLAEGAFVYLSADGLFNRDVVEPEAKQKFAQLWDSIIKKKDLLLYGWDANPWVWVIEFERIEKESMIPC